MVGYTPKQAEAAHRKIRRAVDRADAAIAGLHHLVPDTTISTTVMREQVQRIGKRLSDTVERRTQR